MQDEEAFESCKITTIYKIWLLLVKWCQIFVSFDNIYVFIFVVSGQGKQVFSF